MDVWNKFSSTWKEVFFGISMGMGLETGIFFVFVLPLNTRLLLLFPFLSLPFSFFFLFREKKLLSGYILGLFLGGLVWTR